MGFYQLLHEMGVFSPDAPSTFRAFGTPGQLSAAQLIDRYGITYRPVRDVLVAYLAERQPMLDHTTLRDLAFSLGALFWRDLERHHQHHLAAPAATRRGLEAADQSLTKTRKVAGPDGKTSASRSAAPVACTTWPRSARSTSTSPSGRWKTRPGGRLGGPMPDPRRGPGPPEGDPRPQVADGQRTRERLPVLPALLSRVNDLRTMTAARLATAHAAATPAPHGSGPRPRHRQTPRPQRRGGSGVLDLGRGSRRCGTPGSASRSSPSCPITASSSTPCPAPGNPSRCCRSRRRRPTPNGCWSSAPNSPTSSPRSSRGSVAGTARWGASPPTTPTSGSGTRRCRCCSSAGSGSSTAPSPPPPSGWISGALDGATVTDAAGQPLRFTPHDFRRMFITDAVLHGMPPHIAQLVAGHRDINTTMGYKAVYPDEVINGHRAFIARRRALRPSTEYRVPTQQEWEQFLGHFEHRKLSLGTCGRSYATPCIHEHACLRCPLLRPDPAQRPRLVEIRDNLHARIAEARREGWLGEVDGLQISLTGARQKLAQLDQIATNTTSTQPRDAHLPADRRTLSPTSRSLIGTAGSDSDERSSASAENKRGYGHHPLWAFVDHGPDGHRGAVVGAAAPGNAGSNTAADHITVLRDALRQLPGHRPGHPARAEDPDPGRRGGRHPRAAGLDRRAADVVLGRVHPARQHRRRARHDPASRTGSRLRRRRRTPRRRLGARGDRAARPVTGWPPGMRVIVRKERPHPGAQLRLTDADGHRFTAFATNTTPGGPGRQLADLELRHRRRARAEDRIRAAKDTGLTNLPAARAGPEPDLVRHRRAGLRADRLGPAARPSPSTPPGGGNPNACGCGSSPSPDGSPAPAGAPCCTCPRTHPGPSSCSTRSPPCARSPPPADPQHHPTRRHNPDPDRGTGAHPSDLGRTVVPTRQNHPRNDRHRPVSITAALAGRKIRANDGGADSTVTETPPIRRTFGQPTRRSPIVTIVRIRPRQMPKPQIRGGLAPTLTRGDRVCVPG